MKQIILYKCDPEKNTGCKKTHCKFNPAVIGGECDMTLEKKFAILDDKGEPIIGFDATLGSRKNPIQLNI